MTRKEFVAVCVEHNIMYDIDTKSSISISAPKGKVLGDVHYADYYLEDEPMSEAYQNVVESYINYIDDCDDPECDCHNQPDRPAVVPEVQKPVVVPEVTKERIYLNDMVWNEVGVKDGIEYTHEQYFKFNDGGRQSAGYKGSTGDCVTRSIAIVTGKPYKEVYDALNQLSESERTGKRKKKKSNSRTGVFKATSKKYLLSLGYEWIPTMQIGQGCKTHLRADELPSGKLIVKVSKHMTTMIDGVINDTHDCSREGSRCVYGYFHKKVVN